MARKRLSVKETKKTISLRKRLEVKTKNADWPNKVSLEDVFADIKYIQASSTIITDDWNIALIVNDSDEFLYKNGIANKIAVEPLMVDENDLQSEFNRKEQLDVTEVDEHTYAVGSIGLIPSVQYNWLIQTYPSCVFHQITKWFGKKVNTLVIVLVEEFGKPVAIVKTQE